jgi:FKBP-type peptidyl-prolyl cis-trans isomerase (trigger factor)
VLACLMLWGVYTYIDHQGYQRAAVEYQARYDQLVSEYNDAHAKEIMRQVMANNAAKALEAARIAELQAANSVLETRIKELADEADKDPDAGRAALGAAGVQRINKIR